MELTNKRIIVTGCARGMGAATIRAYVNAGASVVGMDLADDDGKKVCADANVNGTGNATYMNVDVSDKASVTAAFAAAVKQLGGLDALAHPAAIHRGGTASEVSVEDWDLMFDVNVRGTMLTNQAAFPYIKAAGGGAIINFGSISGQRAEPTASAYSASKGAVHSWTRTAAGTWGQDRVRVNAILPAIATPMYYEAHANFNDKDHENHYWRNMQNIAMGQEYGDPDEDLGPVMVFMASDASKFITGQLIPVDGGQHNVR